MILNRPSRPLAAGTVGKSSLAQQISPDICGHTLGSSPTGILFEKPTSALTHAFPFVMIFFFKPAITFFCMSCFVKLLNKWGAP